MTTGNLGGDPEDWAPMIVSVCDVNFDGPRPVVEAIERVVREEASDATVSAAVVDPSYLASRGARRLPVIMINRQIVWEGDVPPPEVVREWLNWPRTLDAAVKRVLASLPADLDPDSLEGAHFGWGGAIRNSFGLWGGNVWLLRACGSETMDADDASAVILDEVRRRLNRKPPQKADDHGDEMAQNSLDSTARDRLLTFLARLGSRLGNPPDPPEGIRSLLQEAYDQGLDPKELYRVSASSRPEWWPPAPPYQEVRPD